MNRPIIKAARQRQTSKRQLIDVLIQNEECSSFDGTADSVPTIFASGAISNRSVNLIEKAMIPPRIRRARSHPHPHSFYLENGSASETSDEEAYYPRACYPSGAVSTNKLEKPTIRRTRRAKTRHDVIQAQYDYDSIWTVPSRKGGMLRQQSVLIEAVMNKPCVHFKRKQKSRRLNVESLTAEI